MRFVGLMAISIILLTASAEAQDPIKVVTTTTVLRSLAEAVGGSRVEVTSVVRGEMDAEEYQPKPQDVLRLKHARLLVRVGLDFDLWVDRLLAQAANGKISRGAEGYVDASYGIAVLELRGMSVGPTDGHAHGSGNPHYWLDPRNAEIITANILEGLSRIDPEHAPEYEANRSEFVRRLSQKISDWQLKLQPLKGIPVVAYHNSWPYFARRFGIDFMDFVESKPGVPPAASHLAALIRTMRSRSARLLVREPQEPERDVSFLAERVGGSVVTLSTSVGGLQGTIDYFSMFDVDVAALLAAAKQND
jgi:ABC-type Zn uptake system ZnuABC Zn-binding protein ZnuA